MTAFCNTLPFDRKWYVSGHDVFDRLPQDDQRQEIASTLRRLDLFEDYDQIRHIVGQSASTLHFSDIMDTGKILFVKLSQALPPDVKRIIGTILISNLVHAVLLREQMPEEKRRHFCIFVDEFQNFASSDDFAVLFTQARKYAVATTIAHQERYGQFADNKRISGATDAAVTKIFFRVSVRDAQEQAPEFAKAPTTTETRLEPVLVISKQPFWDLLLKGHPNQRIQILAEKLFRPFIETQKKSKWERDHYQQQRTEIVDRAGILRINERREALYQMQERYLKRYVPVDTAPLDATQQVLQTLGSVNSQIQFLTNLNEHMRESIEAHNAFWHDVMEGSMKMGTEVFAKFLGSSQIMPNIFEMLKNAMNQYIFTLLMAVKYGDPKVPRTIPFSTGRFYNSF